MLKMWTISAFNQAKSSVASEIRLGRALKRGNQLENQETLNDAAEGLLLLQDTQLMVNKAIQTLPELCHTSTQTSNEPNHTSAQTYIDSKSAETQTEERDPSFVAQCPQLADLTPAAAIVRYSASELTDEAIKFYMGLIALWFYFSACADTSIMLLHTLEIQKIE